MSSANKYKLTDKQGSPPLSVSLFVESSHVDLRYVMEYTTQPPASSRKELGRPQMQKCSSLLNQLPEADER